MAVYWRNQEHKENFMELNRIFKSERYPEYQVVLYLSSLPMIYHKVRKHVTWDKPASWAFKYIEWNEQYKKGWSEAEHDRWLDDKPFDLTSSMKGLMKLMLHLYNNSNEVNLSSVMSSLDDHNQRVLVSMIEISMGFYKNGLLNDSQEPVCQECSSNIDVIDFYVKEKKYVMCADCRHDLVYNHRK